MEIAIIGRKNTGKSTLFSLLTGIEVPAFTTDAHIGMSDVPDERVDYLRDMYKPKKTVYAKVQFIDAPGVSRDQFFSAASIARYRNSDALLYVIRAYSRDDIEAEDRKEPADEVKQFEEEGIIADLSSVESRINSLHKSILKRKAKEDEEELKLMTKLKEHLEGGKALRMMEFTEEEAKKTRGFGFLSMKPMLYVLNVGEAEMGKGESLVAQYGLSSLADTYHGVSYICCSLEKDISLMTDAEKATFMAEYGITTDARKRMLKASFQLLKKICFLTVGPDEVRAWPINEGTIARLAAGTIHSDIEKGFIRAEIFNYADIKLHKTEEKLKDLKLIRLEGKEYIVKDGDIVHFRFNV